MPHVNQNSRFNRSDTTATASPVPLNLRRLDDRPPTAQQADPGPRAMQVIHQALAPRRPLSAVGRPGRPMSAKKPVLARDSMVAMAMSSSKPLTARQPRWGAGFVVQDQAAAPSPVTAHPTREEEEEVVPKARKKGKKGKKKGKVRRNRPLSAGPAPAGKTVKSLIYGTYNHDPYSVRPDRPQSAQTIVYPSRDTHVTTQADYTGRGVPAGGSMLLSTTAFEITGLQPDPRRTPPAIHRTPTRPLKAPGRIGGSPSPAMVRTGTTHKAFRPRSRPASAIAAHRHTNSAALDAEPPQRPMSAASEFSRLQRPLSAKRPVSAKRSARPKSAHGGGRQTTQSTRPAARPRSAANRYIAPGPAPTKTVSDAVYGHLVTIPASKKAESVETKLLHPDQSIRNAGLNELTNFGALPQEPQEALLEMGIVSVLADMLPQPGMKRRDYRASPTLVYKALRGVLGTTVVRHAEVAEYMARDCGVLQAAVRLLETHFSLGLQELLVAMMSDSFIVQTEFRLLGGVDRCSTIICDKSVFPQNRAAALVLLGHACTNNRESLEQVAELLFDGIMELVGRVAPAFRSTSIEDLDIPLGLGTMTPLVRRDSLPPQLGLRLYAAEFIGLAALENSSVLTKVGDMDRGLQWLTRVMRCERSARMTLLAASLSDRLT